MNTPARFAQNLIRQREKFGLSPKELADRADLTLAEIESFEANQQEPSLKALVKLSGSLGVSVGVLLEGLERNSH